MGMSGVSPRGGRVVGTGTPDRALRDIEKKLTRERCQELLKYFQYTGYELNRMDEEDSIDRKTTENRFASSFMEKLLMYLDSSFPYMKLVNPSANFSRRTSYVGQTDRLKVVLLPLMEKYFCHHRHFFTSIAYGQVLGVASMREKESVASLFCKLATVLQTRLSSFGSDIKQAVQCLRGRASTALTNTWVLVKAVDARSLAKCRPEFVKTSMLLLFNNCAEDLEKTIANLQTVSVKGVRSPSQNADDVSQVEGDLQEDWSIVIRDLYAFLPLLIKYVDIHQGTWIQTNVAAPVFLTPIELGFEGDFNSPQYEEVWSGEDFLTPPGLGIDLRFFRTGDVLKTIGHHSIA
eukprot:maker-scaffold565_size135592-snap-gene-0.24 protein:Tk01865 transcript:maker-scaffold565_size135592-snap-gene-0.24-mRNA-1 annotation:"ryanodine receptor 1"